MGQRIPPEKAKELFDNWTAPSGPGKAVAKAGFKDTYETWFNLGELRDFLDYIADNIPEGENPGIRIYFGSYGNGNPKSKQSTVFLAPTRGAVNTDDLAQIENDYELDAYNTGGGSIPPKVYDPNQ